VVDRGNYPKQYVGKNKSVLVNAFGDQQYLWSSPIYASGSTRADRKEHLGRKEETEESFKWKTLPALNMYDV